MNIVRYFTLKFVRYMTKEAGKKPTHLCDFSRLCFEVRLADVLLIEGTNRISRIIQRITQSPWSHAALYIGRLHDIEDPQLRELIHQHYQGSPSEQLLIEALPGHGTYVRPITVYEKDHIRICRPNGLAHQDAQQVINYSIRSIGKDYNFRHLLDLWRFMIKWRFMPQAWQSTLFSRCPNEATQEICSAMIAAAFRSVNFPVLPLIREDDQQNFEMIHRNPKLFTPSDFDYSPYFDIIKYPPFATKHAPYHSLPWNDALVSSDEIGVHDFLPKQCKKDAKHKKLPPKKNHP